MSRLRLATDLPAARALIETMELELKENQEIIRTLTQALTALREIATIAHELASKRFINLDCCCSVEAEKIDKIARKGLVQPHEQKENIQ